MIDLTLQPKNSSNLPSRYNCDLSDNSKENIEVIMSNLLHHLESHKELSPRKLYLVAVGYLEQSLGLNHEELPSNSESLKIYNCLFDLIDDYFQKNCTLKINGTI